MVKTIDLNNRYDINLVKDNKIMSLYQCEGNLYLSCHYSDFRDIKSIVFEINSKNKIYELFEKLYNNLDNYKIISLDYSIKCPHMLKIRKQENNIALSFYKIFNSNYYKPSSVIVINVSEYLEFHQLFNDLQNNKTKKLKK